MIMSEIWAVVFHGGLIFGLAYLRTLIFSNCKEISNIIKDKL